MVRVVLAGPEVLVAICEHIRFGQSSFAAAIRHCCCRDIQSRSDFIRDDTDVGRRVCAIGRNEIDIREQHIADKVTALQQQPWGHPTSSFRPACHRWRRKEPLAEGARRDVEVRNTRNLRESQLLVRRNGELNRALDLSADRRRAVEVARQENRLEQRGNLVAVSA